MRQRARKPKRYRVEGADPAYLEWLRGQVCMVARELGTEEFCRPPIHAAHLGERGLGMKCPDSQSASLCAFHHLDDSHDHSPRGWICKLGKMERRGKYDEWIATQRSEYLASTGGI